jgi:hypothetical protein
VKKRATIELVLAAVAAVGCVASWMAARSVAVAAPVIASEPSKATTVYDPSMVTLAMLLAAVAGVFVVLGVARLRRG